MEEKNSILFIKTCKKLFVKDKNENLNNINFLKFKTYSILKEGLFKNLYGSIEAPFSKNFVKCLFAFITIVMIYETLYVKCFQELEGLGSSLTCILGLNSTCGL